MKWRLYPIEAFRDYSQEWNRLNTICGNVPVLDARFISPLLDNFGPQKKKLAICEEDADISCMTIVSPVQYGVWQTFQPSQAPIGCWVQKPRIPTEPLGHTLCRALPGPTFALGITQQDPCLLPRPDHSRQLNTLDYIATARVTVDGSFDDYWARRGKNLRHNLRRQRNRLSKDNVDARLSIIQSPDLIRAAVTQYGEIESSGWKSALGTAVASDNVQGRFYRQLLEDFSKTAQSVIFKYFYDNHLVAMDLCVLGGGNLVILKTTYDETIKNSSPAMLMREEAFQYIFSTRLAKRIEFYGKVMDWHTKWTNDIRTMYHVNIYSRLGAILNALTMPRGSNR